jgi:hypothetical protein
VDEGVIEGSENVSDACVSSTQFISILLVAVLLAVFETNQRRALPLAAEGREIRSLGLREPLRLLSSITISINIVFSFRFIPSFIGEAGNCRGVYAADLSWEPEDIAS